MNAGSITNCDDPMLTEIITDDENFKIETFKDNLKRVTSENQEELQLLETDYKRKSEEAKAKKIEAVSKSNHECKTKINQLKAIRDKEISDSDGLLETTLESLKQDLPRIDYARGKGYQLLKFFSRSEELLKEQKALFDEARQFQELGYQFPSKEFQRETISSLEVESEHVGLMLMQKWCPIYLNWLNAWKSYVGYQGVTTCTAPGPIDNSLITEEQKLKKWLECGKDFVFIRDKMWDHLESWYGGGPKVICPTVLKVGIIIIDHRPLCLKVYRSAAKITDNQSSTAQEMHSSTAYEKCRLPQQNVRHNSDYTVNVSAHMTLGDFKNEICSLLGLNPDDVRVWDYHACTMYCLLTVMEKTLDQFHIIDGQEILIQEKNECGLFPR